MTPAPAKILWPAPSASRPVHATVSIPGSKSATNRALILAALADSPSTISGGLSARDTVLMIGGLRETRVDVEDLAAAGSSGSEGAALPVTPSGQLLRGRPRDLARVRV